MSFFPNTANQSVAGNLTVSGTEVVTGAETANGGLTVNGSTLVANNGTQFGPHINAIGAAAPTAAAGANAGTGPPAPVVNANAKDAAGSLTFGTGTTPAAGAMVGVTFGAAYTNAPSVVIVPGNTLTQALGLYVSAVTNAGFTISCTTAPAASQGAATYAVEFISVGMVF